MRVVREQTQPSHTLNLIQSTVSSVNMNGTAVRKAGENTTSLMAKTDTKHREPRVDGLERLLKLFILSSFFKSRRCMPLSTALVMTKALSLYEDTYLSHYNVILV